MSPLPRVKVNQAIPFAVTGLDHAGPVYTCDFLDKKRWVLLCTCGVMRAIHLELVPALSTKENLLAICRFAARSPPPHTPHPTTPHPTTPPPPPPPPPRVLYSDNVKGLLLYLRLGGEVGGIVLSFPLRWPRRNILELTAFPVLN